MYGKVIYLKGGTRFEFQIGKYWITILRPGFIKKRNLNRLILFGCEE